MRRSLPLLLLMMATLPLAASDADVDVLPVSGTDRVIERAGDDPVAGLGIAHLFQPKPMITTASGMLIAEMTPEVVIARVGPDGKIETTCVSTLEAAREFVTYHRTENTGGRQD